MVTGEMSKYQGGVVMKRLLEIGQEYMDGMKVRDMALLKVCLLSLGLMLGCMLPKRWRRPAFITAALLFIAAYVPLIYKLVRLLCPCCCGEEE